MHRDKMGAAGNATWNKGLQRLEQHECGGQRHYDQQRLLPGEAFH